MHTTKSEEYFLKEVITAHVLSIPSFFLLAINV